MRVQFLLHGMIVWLVFAGLTILLGIFRELMFIPMTGFDGMTARAILIPISVAYIFLITYGFLKKEIQFTQKDTLLLAIIWVIGTILFEFVFGTLVMGNNINVLINDYNIFAGNVWILFLISLFLAPILVGRYLLKRKS
jgi:hypothetical protein